MCATYVISLFTVNRFQFTCDVVGQFYNTQLNKRSLFRVWCKIFQSAGADFIWLENNNRKPPQDVTVQRENSVRTAEKPWVPSSLEEALDVYFITVDDALHSAWLVVAWVCLMLVWNSGRELWHLPISERVGASCDFNTEREKLQIFSDLSKNCLKDLRRHTLNH